MNTKQIVQNYLDIFFGEKFNPEKLTPLLTEDFHFQGPMMTANSLKEFITNLKTFGSEIKMDSEIFRLVAEKNTVVAHYDFLLPNGRRVPASEWYEIEGEKISKMFLFCDSKLFFDNE
ncbi:nuclear transport factor 2 family protein [Polaribacter batillariae]|uniref:Nuclear transport factor 2 family protein n=1 Tax=Polaribacter batillariae TaxID=2808900 RepID=A0ABX7SV04_9FLAO|nr:nuclear transport factor 2 family protein [Polaribacter batillariae]QTD38079.1 nuclear transport factor 2 family protein [Polaribacter batillariae]